MAVLREIVKSAVPLRMRDRIRYVLNSRYRGIIRRAWQRTHQQGLVAEAAADLWGATGGMVASGPFKGMSYIRESAGSQWAPKLLGTYEMELAPIMEAIIARPPVRVVDIGAAEGYYAVGLAWRIPSTLVIAFEAQETARKLLEDVATANGVADHIEVRGHCSPEWLNDSLQGGTGTLVICDVEGAELQLLDPVKSPDLSYADVLVEAHPWGHERMAEMLRQRFRLTHSVREIHARPRDARDLPALGQPLPPANAVACMDEMRPCAMTWLWMTARERGQR